MTDETAARARSSRRRVLVGVAALAVLVVLAAAWLGLEAKRATSTVSDLNATADSLQTDVAAFDVNAVASDLATLHDEASGLHRITSDPLWFLVAHLPGVGPKAADARTLGSVSDELASAAYPLASLLPRFTPETMKASGGRIDTDALSQLGPVLSGLASAASDGSQQLNGLDPAGLSAAQSRQVAHLRQVLGQVTGPLGSGAQTAPLVARLLGADGPRTWFVALENLAEARGTGGIVGAYAILRADHGRITLVQAAPRKTLGTGPTIPTDSLPTDFQQLWVSDAAEWAGLNLSPHFPYTGQLVVAGWKARGGGALDGVVGLDQRVVAALLAGTGPVTVSGVTVDSGSAFSFLTKDVYARFPAVVDKDAAVVELVRAVFQRVSSGQVSLGPLVRALRDPVSQGDLQVYSTHADEQAQLAQHVVGGVLPDSPGPFAMADVINGGGNKLDAYTSVKVDYDVGTCTDTTRIGSIAVTVTDGAPRSGLPAYVIGRLDLPSGPSASAAPGSNKDLVYVYGPANAQLLDATLDDVPVDVPEGLERGHPVWRFDVVLQPGQTRTVSVDFSEDVDPQAPVVPAVTPTQVMAIPQTVTVHPARDCGSG